MLYKFKRHKPRKGFAVDRIFKGLSTNNFSKNGRHLFTTHKYLSQFFDDDRFCNMLVQWNESINCKISSVRSKRLFPYYPSYIPLITQKTVISKDDFYRISSGYNYRCVNCGKETYVEWGSRGIQNFLCNRCISIHFLKSDNSFYYSSSIKSMYGEKFSKNILEFFSKEQENEKDIIKKILKRRQNYLKSMYPNDKSKIAGIYNSLRSSLPL